MRKGQLTISTASMVVLFIAGVSGLAAWVSKVSDKADAVAQQTAQVNATVSGLSSKIDDIQSTQKHQEALLEEILLRQSKLVQTK